MLPKASISYQSSKRLRIKIPSQKGDYDYFQSLGEKLVKYQDFDVLQLNPVTGSVLFLGERLDVSDIEVYGRENGLFDLKCTGVPVVPLARRIADPLSGTSAFLSRTTGGFLDLPGAAVLALLAVGLYEILRGNFRSPPWYTAFWYAFGVFTKSVADIASKKKEAR